MVLKAIQEFDRFGRESFPDKYGFGHAKLLYLRLESDCRRGPSIREGWSGTAEEFQWRGQSRSTRSR